MISRGTKGLSERYRPQLFSEMIGQSKLVEGIRNRWSKGKRPTALMFSGETGNGKTTLARIISVAVNCTHQKQFGEPCKECRKNPREQFDIIEHNAADVSGKAGIREVIDGWQYAPQPPARMRVFILDEAHSLLKQSQQMLLKPFEDGPDSTLWIICTTEPQSIIRTLRGRCVHWPIPLLSLKNMQKLVRDVIANECQAGRIEQPKEETVAEFLDALGEQQVFQPRLILNNLETFLTTLDPTCVVGIAADDMQAVGRYILNGDWSSLSHQIEDFDGQQIEGLRRGALGYLRKVLMNTKASNHATRVSECIRELGNATSYEEAIASSLIVSALYRACRRFKRG